MRRRCLGRLGPVFLVSMVLAAAPLAAGDQAPAAQVPAASASPDSSFTQTYCVTCHSKRLHTGDLVLEGLDPARAPENVATWEKVVRKVRVGVMPPAGARQPDHAASAAFVAGLQTALDRAAEEHRTIGHVPAVHRLNRTEYANAIRDLLAVDRLPKELDISVLLPPDDTGGGFDNMADALYVSPTLIERYVGAAGKISRLAIGDPSAPPIVDTYRASGQMPQDKHIEGLPFGTRGGMRISRTFPLDGKYSFAVQVAQGGAYEPNRDAPPYRIELTIDGQRAKVFTQQKGEGRRGGRGAGAALQTELDVTAGPHDIGITFLAEAAAPVESLTVPYRRSLGIEQAAIAALTISGPTAVTGVGDTPARRRIFICRPHAETDELPCATRILSTLARRAYRRPVVQRDVDPLLAFYRKGRAEAGFDFGIRRAVERLLVSPEFLFRIETPPAAGTVGPVPLTDVELASRLSFFFWSSIPDDELLDAASAGRLHAPEVFAKQVRRMIADERSDALIRNFVGQWLYLRDLTDVKHPDDRLFPDFDEGLQASMRRETELFFGSLVRENHSVLDLLRANYTYLNERLAQHYGIPNVHGSQFRRVELPADSARRGLLGQGSVLTVTSYANRTSPVNRGKFILETLLSMPPPPPPAVVPSLKDTDASGAVLSMRARMEQHRKDPACASCHKQMDPLGFALENFDAVGRWRTVGESQQPIDNSGTLTNGSTFKGVAGLRSVLLGAPFDTEFVYTVVSKLMAYALGRPLDAVDQPAIRRIMRGAAPSQYSFDAVMLGIVDSPSFRMKQAAPAATVADARR